ncbi:MAG: hypothetical protein IJY92_07070 [Alphaproteobacteria bacterium]|nr:hypothetical protein [Alphaproteobacteria bacterium]
MIRKILGIILIITLLFFGHTLTKEKPKPVYTDTPSIQEQQQIELEQKIPAAMPENEMEQLSPEDAEKDQ